MKRRFMLMIVVFIATIIWYVAFYNSPDTYQRIDVFKANGFNRVEGKPIISFHDEKTLKVFSRMVRESRKIRGLLDVSEPNYLLEITRMNKRVMILYLWVDADSSRGMYMHSRNDYTGYSIPIGYTEQLKEILKLQ